MADQATLDIYAELYKRNAVPEQHKPIVDELVRRGVIGGKKTYGPGDTLDDGTVLDDQGLERGNVLPIARDPNTNTLSLAVPGMLYHPYSAFKKSAETGTITPGDALGIAGMGITGTNFVPKPVPYTPAISPGRQNALMRSSEFEAAGVPVFAPALRDNMPGAETVMGGLFGGPLRNRAQLSIQGVERGVQDAIAPTGAARPVNEIGNEVKGDLRRSIVERSRSPEEIDNMTRFELQDISGVGPGPNAPRNAPPVPRVQPEPWNPQRRAITDADVDAAMQNPPRLPTPVPRQVMLEDVILPPQMERAVQDAGASRAAAEQFLSGNADKHQELQGRWQQLSEAEKNLPEVPRPRPVGGRFSSPQEAAQHAASEQAYNATLPQRQALARTRAQLEQEYAPFAQAERALADADHAHRQANAYRHANLTRAQQAEAERVSREAQDNYQLRMSNAREEARQRAERLADVEHLADVNDPARRSAFEAQARNRARSETERAQYTADQNYRTELQTRQAQAIPQRVGGNSRESYNTEFDAGYAAARANTPPIQMNPLGRLGDARLSETAKLLDSVATDYRKQGLLPGYRSGEVFADNGTVKPEILSIIDRLGGPGVSERMRALSERRPRGAAQLGIEGLDQIRTAIGQALSDAKQKPIGGLTQGEGASQRARAAFLSRLYDAVGRDVDQAVANVPGGELASRQRTVLRDSYRDFMTEIRAPLSKLFGEKTTPEQAVKMLTDAARGGDRGNINLLNAYFRVAREKGDVVRASGAILTEMAQGGLEGFLASYRGMPPEVRTLMSQGEMRPIFARLDALATVGGHLERYARLARPDQSVADVARRVASGNNALMGLITYLHAPSAIVYAVGQAGAARTMASPAFQRWLTRMPVTRTPADRRAHIKALVHVLAAQSGMSEPAAKEVKRMLMDDDGGRT